MSKTARLEDFYNIKDHKKSVPRTFAIYKDSTDDITDLMGYMPQEASIFVDVFQDYHPRNLEETAEKSSIDPGAVKSVRTEKSYETFESVDHLLENPENHETVDSHRALTSRDIRLNSCLENYDGAELYENDVFYVLDDVDCAVPMIDDEKIFSYVKAMSDKFKSLGADVVLLLNEESSERAVRDDIRNLAEEEKHMLDV